jgi:hypothetical protein
MRAKKVDRQVIETWTSRNIAYNMQSGRSTTEPQAPIQTQREVIMKKLAKYTYI